MSQARAVNTVGLEMPPEFPTDLYNSIHAHVEAARSKRPAFWRDYGPSWNAVAYRYRACCDFADEFVESLKTHDDGPPQPARYLQDRALFGFFTNALSTLEAMSYALYAIGATARGRGFRLKTESDRRNVKLKSTAVAYEKAFPSDPLAVALRRTVSSPERLTIERVRNVLAHRAQPGRRMFLSVGSSTQLPARWFRGLLIRPALVERKRTWLVRSLRQVLMATDRFVSTRL